MALHDQTFHAVKKNFSILTPVPSQLSSLVTTTDSTNIIKPIPSLSFTPIKSSPPPPCNRLSGTTVSTQSSPCRLPLPSAPRPSMSTWCRRCRHCRRLVGHLRTGPMAPTSNGLVRTGECGDDGIVELNKWRGRVGLENFGEMKGRSRREGLKSQTGKMFWCVQKQAWSRLGKGRWDWKLA